MYFFFQNVRSAENISNEIFSRTYLCRMAGIYIHIPFCKQKCTYCDFHFSTTFVSYRAQMIEALCTEIRLRLSQFDEPIDVQTLYLGGGTPSLLLESELKSIVETLAEFVTISNIIEFTLEANPDDIDLTRLELWKNLGINRLSIGIQSFDDNDLKWMNRAHSAEESWNAILQAQQNGFTNISIDLMYGLPNQSFEKWQRQLETALQLGVPHISSYCLTVEERTALKKFVERRELVIPDEDLVAEQFDFLVETLEKHGLVHYEISNFALPNAHAIHNSNYWKGAHYWGIGPSAHGFDGTHRYWNISNNREYIKILERGDLPETIEILTPENKFNELILTGLRTQWGVDFLKLRALVELSNLWHQKIVAFERDGVLEWVGDNFRLTKKAKLQADFYAAELFM